MKLHDVPNGSFAATQSSAVDEAEVEGVERSASFEPLELESNEDDEADLLNSSSPASRARARAPFPALAALSALLKCRPCACTQGQARLGLALVFVTVAAVVVALLVTATGHKETGYESDAPSIPSTGCLSPMVGPTLPGSYAETIIVDGIKRTYRFHVPMGTNRSKPMPLVLGFHGWGGNGLEEEVYGGFAKLGDEVGAAAGKQTFYAVFPDGLADVPPADKTGTFAYGSWNTGGTTSSGSSPFGPTCASDRIEGPCYLSCQARQANDPCAQGCDWSTCVDDFGFVNAMLDEIEARHCVDRARVYATGMSNGAMMTYAVAMERRTAHRFAAVAPVSGSPHYGFLRAPPVKMPLMQVHGLADDTIPPYPPSQGQVNKTISYNKWFYSPIRDSARVFAARNCMIPPPTPRPSRMPLGAPTGSWTAADIYRGEDVKPAYAKREGAVIFDEDDVYATAYDGIDGLHCHYTAISRESEVRCFENLRPEVITCLWDGGHTWPTSNYSSHLIWEFFSRHARDPTLSP